MRSAFITYPKACLLHAIGLAGLMVTYQQIQLPWFISIPSFLLLALWPWLGPWQRQHEELPVSAETPHDAFSTLSQNLSRHTCHNALAAAEVAHAAQQLAGKLQSQLSATEQINQAAEAITHTEQDSAQRAEQTLIAAQSVRQDSSSGQQELRQAIDAMQHLSAQTATSRELIDGLSSRTEQIEKVTQVIQSIASQTNLLALNAAIEAARAGDLGRGFAVVADEVRSLAQRTQNSTEEIELMISSIQQGTGATVGALQSSAEQASHTLRRANSAGQALEKITASISQINQRNLVIASAAEQQALVAREVDQNLVTIRDLSTQTAAGATQTSAASQELSRLAIDLNGLVTRFVL